MTARHRLLTLYPGVRTGGCFRRLTMMLDAATRAGWDVHYVSSEPFPCSGKHHPLPAGRGRQPLGYAAFILAASAAIPIVARRERIDRMAIFGEHIALACVPARVALGIPLVNFAHGWLGELVRSRGLPGLLMRIHAVTGRLTMPFIDATWSVSRELRAKLVEFYRPSSPIGLLYNNIETHRFRPDEEAGARVRSELGIPAGDTVIGYSGHLIPTKNVEYLLDAFERIRAPGRWLVVAGTGEKEQELRSRAGEQVRFLGWRSDMPAVLNACDTVVLPSLHEGFPLSLLEALGCGRIALASRAGGNPEVLADEELLFGLDDGGQQLAGKLARLAEDAGYRADLKRRCDSRARALDFDWDAAMLRAIDRACVEPDEADLVTGPRA